MDLTKTRTDFFEAGVIEYPTAGGPARERQHPTRGIRHARSGVRRYAWRRPVASRMPARRICGLPDLGGWSGPRQQSGGNNGLPGSPEWVRSSQRRELRADFVTVR